MRKKINRPERINDLIQNALAEILRDFEKELNLGFITVTGVAASPDLSYAKVFISVLDETQAKQIIKALNENSRTLRYSLAQAVKLRVTPELKFVYDDSSLRGARISTLINQAEKK